MKRFHIILISVLAFSTLMTSKAYSQDLLFGIRAGLNYAKILGPAQEGVVETNAFNNGFHFGITVGYQMNEFISFRSEILYVQNGTKYKYEGESYHVFNIPSNPRYAVFDSSKLNLDVSNAYVSLPLTIHIRTLDRWEFHAGVYGSILVSPIGAGKLRFGTDINYEFEQGQDHDYDSDLAGMLFNPFINDILLIVNGEDSAVRSIANAYDQYVVKDGNKYNKFDYGITGGISYYLNRGLFLGLKFDYGLKDLTNNRMDRSLKELGPDGEFILREDFDRNFGFHVSLGFTF